MVVRDPLLEVVSLQRWPLFTLTFLQQPPGDCSHHRQCWHYHWNIGLVLTRQLLVENMVGMMSIGGCGGTDSWLEKLNCGRTDNT